MVVVGSAVEATSQNKNLSMILMALRELHSARLFRVEMTFLVSGHFSLPCDCSFGMIENKICLRQLIFTPSEYCSVTDSTKFNLYEVKREDIKDIKCLTDKVTVRRATQRRFSKASQIITTTSYKEGYLLKNDFSDHTTDGDAFHVCLQPGKRDTKNSCSTCQPILCLSSTVVTDVCSLQRSRIWKPWSTTWILPSTRSGGSSLCNGRSSYLHSNKVMTKKVMLNLMTTHRTTITVQMTGVVPLLALPPNSHHCCCTFWTPC